tara:strand:- start:16 stop:840 length:825 start_codon:yes stop_codon:yes gene_type:complete
MILLFAKKTKKFSENSSQECLILGNGPSLLDDLNRIKNNFTNKTLICVNDFALSQYYLTLQPSVYVFLDPYYWSELDTDRSEHLELFNNRKKLFDRILLDTDWPLKIYVPFAFKKSKLYKDCENKFIKFVFFNSIPIQGFKRFIDFGLNKRLGLLKSSNVLTPAIYYAIFSGFNTVYLSGADHSWLNAISISHDSKLQMAQLHFDEKKASYKPVYLIPSDSSPAKLHELLYVYSNVFKNYWILSNLAKKRNCRIINLTIDSYIDAFPKLIIQNI